ncbi:MAG TPA: VOC family protein [Stellaceae bacterium]|nr:VOC family protein [Stellaceae bacterium]
MTRRSIVQNGYVVRDLDAAVAEWTRIAGIGPFLVTPPTEFEARYHGRPTMLRAQAALAQAGDLQIELIQPVGDGPSIYTEGFPHGGEGLHHVCMVVEELGSELARYDGLGIPVVLSAEYFGIRLAYLDARAALGSYLELVEDGPQIRGFYAAVRHAAEEWDGVTDPVRPLG